MKKFILGAAAATAVAVSLAAGTGIASADVSTNKSAKDAYGYCVANYIANFNTGTGIGHLRSEMTGQEISSATGNRAPSYPCVDTQGQFAPISNNG